MRLAGLAAAVALVLGGCGYAEDEAGADSPREAFELFVTAVKEGDSKGAELVSEQLPSEHRAAFLREMRDNVQPLASGFRIVLDELVDERLAVVAAEGADGHAPGAFAAVLVREDEAWFIQPQSLDLLYGVSPRSAQSVPPTPGSTSRSTHRARPGGRRPGCGLMAARRRFAAVQRS